MSKFELVNENQTKNAQNVGILAIEIYFPKCCITQEALEAADECRGKYTIGLGQNTLAFCDDREDITSIFLNVFRNLLRSYDISPDSIGRLEVGTETLVDKSKSVKTALMSLLGSNSDVEGATSVNACYGGSAALFNSVAWVESSAWDGRFAVVVCGDIAVYEAGPARPTGGCGAVAILVGPDAPLVLNPLRATHAMDVYDFYKPRDSEYPLVDGRLSQEAYLKSLDECFSSLKRKNAARHPDKAPLSLDDFDFFAFHAPYNKLVQKAFWRLHLHKLQASPEAFPEELAQKWQSVDLSSTYHSKEVDTDFKPIATQAWEKKVLPCCMLPKEIGNTYTASVFLGLLSLINVSRSDLCGKKIFMYSYGSGSLATIYTLEGRETASAFSLDRIADTINIFERLTSRTFCTFEEFSSAMSLREACHGSSNYSPQGDISNLFPGTFYLESVNERYQRIYSQIPDI